MFSKLNHIILKSFFNWFFTILAVVSPIIFLADVAFNKISWKDSLLQLPYSYEQSLEIIVLWSMFVGFKMLKVKYSTIVFTLMGFSKTQVAPVIVFIGMFFFCVESCIIVPMNYHAFDERINDLNWVLEESGKKVIFINKKNDKKFPSCWVSENNKLYYVDRYEKPVEGYYLIWNECRKLSWGGLNRYQAYLEKNNLPSYNVIKQRYRFIATSLMMPIMVLCGYAFATVDGVKKMILCTFVAHSILNFASFLPLKLCLFFYAFDLVLWLLVGLWYLFL